MYPYTYRAYWREVGATEWNLIESPSPITWNTQNIPASNPSGFQGGQCLVTYTAYGTFEGQCIPGARNWVSGGIPGRVLGMVRNGSGWRILSSTSNVLFAPVNPQTGAQIYTLTDPSVCPWINYNAQLNTAISAVMTHVVRNDGNPDNCGNHSSYNPGNPASCITTFSTGLIVTRSECIEVTLNPPNECPCCTELLPKTNSILSRLG